VKPQLYIDFKQCIDQAAHWLRYRSSVVHTSRWQGTDISKMPEMATFEVANCSFGVEMSKYDRGVHGLADAMNNAVSDIEPNMPWAEEHFWERVCGYPVNPGVQWSKWPYGNKASTFLDDNGKFNHNYMERYWPKYAGFIANATREPEQIMGPLHEYRDSNGGVMPRPHHGIKYEYGDLNDVVELLAGDELTRQAYLPIWFPEDTGGGSKRAPCTIGYHFLVRDGRMHINYHIRSCDFVRHFRDDLFLTLRLVQWVADRLHSLGRDEPLKLGNFYMQIGSLHMFKNDYLQLWGLSR